MSQWPAGREQDGAELGAGKAKPCPWSTKHDFDKDGWWLRVAISRSELHLT